MLWNNRGSQTAQGDTQNVLASALFASLSDAQIVEMWANKYTEKKGLQASRLQPEQLRLFTQLASNETRKFGIDVQSAILLFEPWGAFRWFYSNQRTGVVNSAGCSYLPEGWLSRTLSKNSQSAEG